MRHYNKNIFPLLIFFFVFFLSNCQSNRILSYKKYQDLPQDKKEEVNLYLKKFPDSFIKNKKQIVLMLSYECFLNQTVTINKNIKRTFTELKNGDHFGKTIFVYHDKEDSKQIDIEISGGKKVSFFPKEGYNFISICYGEKMKEWYI